MGIAYYSARSDYEIIRELPTGYGFADMVFLPKRNVNKPAMVVELKWNKKVDTAIAQIKEKRYAESLKSLTNYKGEILLVGVSYEKGATPEEKRHVCKIEKMTL